MDVPCSHLTTTLSLTVLWVKYAQRIMQDISFSYDESIS